MTRPDRPILVTGFDPFGGASVNPSEVLAAELATTVPGVVAQPLPTTFAVAGQRAIEAIELHNPRAVVMFGLAAASPHLRLEFIARNSIDAAKPDNDGSDLTGSAIVAGGPDIYASTLPLNQLRGSLSAAGIATESSLDAGGYVCNYVFYTVQHYLQTTGRHTPSGFIHVPTEPAQNRAAELILGSLVEL